jgi:hypothetical protein
MQRKRLIFVLTTLVGLLLLAAPPAAASGWTAGNTLVSGDEENADYNEYSVTGGVEGYPQWGGARSTATIPGAGPAVDGTGTFYVSRFYTKGSGASATEDVQAGATASVSVSANGASCNDVTYAQGRAIVTPDSRFTSLLELDSGTVRANWPSTPHSDIWCEDYSGYTTAQRTATLNSSTNILFTIFVHTDGQAVNGGGGAAESYGSADFSDPS